MLNFARLRLWIIIPLLGLAGFALGLAAASGYLWDTKVNPISFGSAAQWATAAVNIIVVSVTLHLADKTRRDAAELQKAAKLKMTKDVEGILATAASQIVRFREDAGPNGEALATMPQQPRQRGPWLEALVEAMGIAARRPDVGANEALHLLAMAKVSSLALSYIGKELPVPFADRAEVLDSMVSDAELFCRLSFELDDPEQAEADIAAVLRPADHYVSGEP